MADAVTQPAAAPAPAKNIGTEPAPKAPVAIPVNGDMVEVKALKPYLGAEDKRVLDGKPYTVTRQRAAELRANGLAEYTDQKDHDAEVEDAVKKAGDSARAKYQVKK